MEQRTIRELRADEIECRVGTISEKGLSLLLFKDARVDQKVLDECFGIFGWKRSHQIIDGNLYCTIEVWDKEKEQWISKQDVGTVSYSEKEKGQASDSFKRACVNLGIGRELYSAPFIWVSQPQAEIERKQDKWVSSERFSVKSITYTEEREIRSIEIVNKRGQIVYSWAREQKGIEEKNAIKAATAKQLGQLKKELERTGIALDTVLERYHISSTTEMSSEVCERAISGLKKTKEKTA